MSSQHLFLTPLALIVPVSCAPRAVVEHDWVTPGVDLRESAWLPVPPSQFFWVRDECLNEALLELREVSLREIPLERAVEICYDAGVPTKDDQRAYLVRGVCPGRKPTFATVRMSASANTLHVHQALVTAELYLPGVAREPALEKRPLVVLVKAPIEHVVVTARYGGDDALRAFRPADSKFCDLPKS